MVKVTVRGSRRDAPFDVTVDDGVVMIDEDLEAGTLLDVIDLFVELRLEVCATETGPCRPGQLTGDEAWVAATVAAALGDAGYEILEVDPALPEYGVPDGATP